MNIPQKYRDLAARAVWTLLQSATAVGIVEWFNLPREWIPAFGMALSALKSFVATKVGDTSTATFTPVAQPTTPPNPPLGPDGLAPGDQNGGPPMGEGLNLDFEDGTSGEVEPA